MGVQPADVSRAMQLLNDSPTRLISEEDSNRWVFRHPTVTDAFAGLVVGSPELVELYAHGAKLDRLIGEVHCGPRSAEGDQIRIPTSLYPELVERLKSYPLDESLKSFLGARCEKVFLALMLKARPDILKWAAEIHASNLSFGSRLLLAALSSWRFLPEADRLRLVEKIRDHSITWLDASPLKDDILQQIFTKDELSDYAERFRKEWLEDLSGLFDELCARFSSDDEVGLFTDFRDNLQIAQRYFGKRIFPHSTPNWMRTSRTCALPRATPTGMPHHSKDQAARPQRRPARSSTTSTTESVRDKSQPVDEKRNGGRSSSPGSAG